MRVEEPVTGVRGVKIEVEEPLRRRIPARRRAAMPRPIVGVEAEQVVHSIAIHLMLRDHVRVLKFAQQHPGLRDGQRSEGRGGG